MGPNQRTHRTAVDHVIDGDGSGRLTATSAKGDR
jgi:hypothetical protein